ncbi:MAG: flagella basal body P-ring formation protein FlgA [Novosphingobium sp.]|nr:flagella basal body P-ring formation protein FlgA [Novosphingobium sp.]
MLASVAALPAQAQPPGYHDLTTIDAAVAAFTGAGAGQPGGAVMPVDRRLRLAPCYSPLVAAWYGGGQDNVIVRCPDPGGWRLFVATSGNGRQDAAAPPAVARGEAITIAVAGDGFAVSQPGEAMEAGPVGAWIRVRTSAKAVPIRARIERPGMVIVPLD